MEKQEKEIVVELRNITKRFGSFVANKDISLELRKGEVHALLGENGAGKTTLMNQLYGLYQPTEGEIWIRGEKMNQLTPSHAIARGIGMVHQHFMLIQSFTVAQNIILGNETAGRFGVLDYKKAVTMVEEISRRYGLSVDPNAKISDITVGMQQRVEILKALYRGAEILIFDEPTAVLTPQEIDEFISIIKKFTGDGKTVIIITHKLKEIMAMADICTIIRRGEKVDTVEVSATSEQELAERMVGRAVSFRVEKEKRKPGETVLSITNLCVNDRRRVRAVDDLSLDVCAGEILGVAGVDGNGQSELVEAIMGLYHAAGGRVAVCGRDVTNRGAGAVIKSGVASIPADRQKHGLIPNFSVAENLIVEKYKSEPFCRRGILNFEAIRKNAAELIERYDVRTPSGREQEKAKNLSGGNQQKVIIAREISNAPALLIASQPTRGLDVGAIEFIHRSIVEQRNKGMAVLLISFELDEILSLSDRIAVMYEGKIAAVLDAYATNEQEIGFLMAGGQKI